jgi:CxxC-x17-CxxC domain-containing protein
MAYFNRENRGGGNGFGKKNFKRGGFGGGDRFNKPRPFMHKAICSNCGAECEVPFKPTGDRPVYCSNCFKKGDNSGPAKFGGNFKEQSFGGERRTFEKPGVPENRGNDQLKSQLEMLNTKLDKILQALTAEIVKPPVEKKAEPKKAKTPLAKVKAAPKKAKKKSK